MNLSRVPRNGRIAAIRFSSLGDVVLVAAALREVHRLRPDIELVLLTKTAYEGLFERQPWIKVWSLNPEEGPRGLFQLARRLRGWRPHLIADLHATLRAIILRLLVPTGTWVRVKKRSIRRLAAVRLNYKDENAGHVVQRYGHVFDICPDSSSWLDTEAASRPSSIALIPGAAWATKMWSADHWASLAESISEQGGKICWVGGPGERKLMDSLQGRAGGEVVCDLSLADLADYLAGCTLAVAGDTGPGHLAAAVGTPVISLLGPTVRSFGFTPWGVHHVIETDLDCRPCSLHGDNECPRGHHRCMLDILPDRVFQTVKKQMDT